MGESGNQSVPTGHGLDWVRRLIAFDTTSRRSNRELIDCVDDYLRGLGLSVAMTSDQHGAKANLFATLPGARGRATGGLILSGHTDVVPVDGQRWTSDPFSAELRGGRLYGRGASDMKGFLGIALGLVPAFRDMALDEPVHLALSFDEEVGCLGAPLMIADIVGRGVSPTGCIVGEPTSMKPVVAHKSIRILRCRVTGLPAHSSRTHEGVNAIEHAARIIAFIRDRGEQLRAQGSSILGFDPPFTTISVGQVEGGTASNIVAEHCEFLFEYRCLPGEDPDRLEAEIRHFIDRTIMPEMLAVHIGSQVTLEALAAVPAFASEEDSELAVLAERLTGAPPSRAAYCTEAGQFGSADIPTIICGPGSIEQAHKGDEWVSLDQLARCERFLAQVVQLARE